MRKPFLTVYLDPALLDALEAYARKRGAAKSTVAEAAISRFLRPDPADQPEAVLTRRLDHLNRHADRLERDLGVAVEMLALFIRFWLAATPPLPESAQAAARAKGRERYEGFVQVLGRRLAQGRGFVREVAAEAEAIREGDGEAAKDVDRRTRVVAQPGGPQRDAPSVGRAPDEA
ncbi:CopG family transcriptional regulator [Brevundimonas sp.]|uniref:CopG family transcriptional regulator n=1 Tax=Brevundimonas sp. TaxID=1871086 RepID=UPI00338D47C1